MIIEDPPEPYRTQILLRLMKLPNLHGVWCDGGIPYIRFEQFGEPQGIGWDEAAKMTGVVLPERGR